MKARNSFFVALVAAALALAWALPAAAQPPVNKDYIVFPGDAEIGAPYNLVYVGFDCIEFKAGGIACMPGVLNDCGTYEITGVDTYVTHVKVNANARIFGLFAGPVEMHLTVDRGGDGSAMAGVGHGKLRGLFPKTRTNVNVVATQSTPGCMLAAANRGENPAEYWVPKK